MIGGLRILPQERIGGDDHTGYAKAALHGAVGRKTLDQPLTPASFADTLDRLDSAPLNRPDGENTRVYEAPVEHNGARTALSFAAPFLYTRES